MCGTARMRHHDDGRDALFEQLEAFVQPFAVAARPEDDQGVCALGVIAGRPEEEHDGGDRQRRRRHADDDNRTHGVSVEAMQPQPPPSEATTRAAGRRCPGGRHRSPTLTRAFKPINPLPGRFPT
jgi:hypothetical protein